MALLDFENYLARITSSIVTLLFDHFSLLQNSKENRNIKSYSYSKLRIIKKEAWKCRELERSSFRAYLLIHVPFHVKYLPHFPQEISPPFSVLT